MTRSTTIKKASQDEQQNQTNFIYIQNFSVFYKKLINKSKYRQIKLKLNRKNCTSLERIWDYSIMKLGTIRQKGKKQQ